MMMLKYKSNETDPIIPSMVGLAIGSDQQVLAGGVRPGIYRDAVTGAEQHSGGSLHFHVKANSAASEC